MILGLRFGIVCRYSSTVWNGCGRVTLPDHTVPRGANTIPVTVSALGTAHALKLEHKVQLDREIFIHQANIKRQKHQQIPTKHRLSKFYSNLHIFDPFNLKTTANAMATVRPTHLATMGNAHQPAVAQLSSQVTAKWELGVSLILDNWDVLTEAVNNLWGGEDSSGKRDWLAGAIVEMFIGQPETDEDDIEFTLLEVMQDEFSVRLEDDSSWVVSLLPHPLILRKKKKLLS